MYQDPTNSDLLAEAIVAQAAKDYLELKKFLHNTREGKEARKAAQELRDIRKFFNSRWYKTLTELDGNYLMEKLDKEFEEWKKAQV